MDRHPVFCGQEFRSPLVSYHQKHFDPKNMGAIQNNRKSTQEKCEASLRHEIPLKRGFTWMDGQYHRPMRHGMLAGSVPSSRRRRNQSNQAQGTQPESHVFSDSSCSKPRILRKNGSEPLPAPYDLDEPEKDTSMLRQPETRPISHDQLVVEVKGIYAGLVMVEAKCIEVDERRKLRAQNKDCASGISVDQWKTLLALHKQLLHEHHDFLLASQHPSASNNLSRLAASKSIKPAKMWRRRIHGFLEVLRHRFPESREYMLAFIYVAYNMMALLFETVPSFEDIWIESLGDLGRYRMAIEDDEPRNREIWSNVARHWYSKASDNTPTTGRLYYNLPILARPNTLEHLSLYTKALTCSVPFNSAKRSILTALNPVLRGTVPRSLTIGQVELWLMQNHARLYARSSNPFGPIGSAFAAFTYRVAESLVDHGGRTDGLWRLKVRVAYFAIASISAVLEYGATDEEGNGRSRIPRSLISHEVDLTSLEIRRHASLVKAGASRNVPVAFPRKLPDMSLEMGKGLPKINPAASFFGPSIFDDETTDDYYNNYRDQSWTQAVLTLIDIVLVFVCSCCSAGDSQTPYRRVIGKSNKSGFWSAVCAYLNEICHELLVPDSQILSLGSGTLGTDLGRPLPEDFMLRGQVYTLQCFPDSWFSHLNEDDEERQLELPSMDGVRTTRIMWWENRLASSSLYLESSISEYDQVLESQEKPTRRAKDPLSVTSTALPHAPHVTTVPFSPEEWDEFEHLQDKPEDGGASQSSLRSSLARLPLMNAMRRMLVGASLLRVTTAMPATSTALETSKISYENFYVGLLYIFSAGLFVGAAQYVSKLQGPLTTHGVAMGVQSLGWWLIANDDATSKGLRSVVLILWTVSTWQYFNAASTKLQIPKWASLGSIVFATGFDICMVRAMTPNNLAVSQNDILTLSLPSVSLVLGVIVMIFPMIRERLGHQAIDRPAPFPTPGATNINAPEHERGQSTRLPSGYASYAELRGD